MAVEVCFLLGGDDAILWADRSASPSAMPDTRMRWEHIWQQRERLVEIAHSHPLGPLEFSEDDTTTIAAVEDALGRRLRWSVVTPTSWLRKDTDGTIAIGHDEPWWVALLRAASGS